MHSSVVFTDGVVSRFMLKGRVGWVSWAHVGEKGWIEGLRSMLEGRVGRVS